MDSVSKSQKVLLALVYPLLIQIAGAYLMMIGDSAASGGPFAGILILVMLMVTAPLTLIVNSITLMPKDQARSWYFKRGMVLPLIFILAYFIYFAGIWDAIF